MSTVAIPARPQRRPRVYVTSQRRHRFLGPLASIVGIAVFWMLSLRNGVFIDEAVYVRTGRAYLDHWFFGQPLAPTVGEGLSGFPMLYPVLAALMDNIGGLELLRAFSLACVVTTAFILRALATVLFSSRTGLITAGLFLFTSSVMFVGHIGTFDAVVILLLAASLYLGIVKDSFGSALVVGVLLALAVMTKYTAYVFVPSVLLASVVGRPWDRERVWRVSASVSTVVVILSAALLLVSEQTIDALRFTTTAREALSPQTAGYLARQVPDHIWILIAAALLGVFWLVRSGQRHMVLLSMLLFTTAALLPLAQMRLGELVSFEKHLAYSALFLAPLAAWGLTRPWKLAIYTPVLVWTLVLAGMWSAFKAHELYTFPDVRPVAEAVQGSPVDGTYLSGSADTLAYYTAENRDITWEPTFLLFTKDAATISAAVAEERYDVVVLRTGPTGSSVQDRGQASMLSALESSEDYRLADTLEADAGQNWVIYERRALES